MRAAVIRFPGSNCDQDCHFVLREFGFATDYLWHKESSAAGYDLIVLPGGFSYGDYLRCGAIARFSPVMKSIIEQAGRGVLVLGICNGFITKCGIFNHWTGRRVNAYKRFVIFLNYNFYPLFPVKEFSVNSQSLNV